MIGMNVSEALKQVLLARVAAEKIVKKSAWVTKIHFSR